MLGEIANIIQHPRGRYKEAFHWDIDPARMMRPRPRRVLMVT
jgi:hypothetical protein